MNNKNYVDELLNKFGRTNNSSPKNICLYCHDPFKSIIDMEVESDVDYDNLSEEELEKLEQEPTELSSRVTIARNNHLRLEEFQAGGSRSTMQLINFCPKCGRKLGGADE